MAPPRSNGTSQRSGDGTRSVRGPHRTLRRSLVGLLLILSVGAARGQERYGAIGGVIFDQTGAVLPGISITLTHIDSGRTTRFASGPYGTYVAPNLEPGLYRMQMELPGFEIGDLPEIRVLPGQTLDMETYLSIGDVTTTIQVTDVTSSQVVSGTTLERTILSEEFNVLPRGRSFQSLATRAAGVNPGTFGGGFQIRGASGAENLFLIDGIPTQSVIDGRSRQDAIFEYLDTVQVITAGIRVESGGAMGGVIGATTRSGGNRIHGEARVFYGGTGITADPVRRLVLDPIDDQTVTYVKDERDRTRNLEGGFALGGPILPDRLFFYAAWSPRKTHRDRSYLLGNGTTPEVFQEEQTLTSGFGKLTFEPNSSVRANVSILWTPTSSEGSLAAFNGAGPNWDIRSPDSLAGNHFRGFFQPQSSYSGSVDMKLNPELVLGVRGGYFWDNYKDTGIPDTSSVEYLTSAVGLSGVPPELQQGVGFTNTPRVLDVANDRTSRWRGSIDLGGALRPLNLENLKAGYEIERSVNNIDAAFPGGGYVFVYWNTTFTGSPTGVDDSGPYGYYEVHDVGMRGSAASLSQAVYFRNQFQPRPGLTLDFGVRLEREVLPGFRPDVEGNTLNLTFSFQNKFAPRVGASWDPFGNGKTRIYGSYGRYFDQNKYEWARGALGSSFWTVRYRSLDTPDVFALSGTNTPGRDLWIPSVPDSYRDLALFDLDATIDFSLRPMSGDEYVIGIDHRWGPQTRLGARYIHRNLRRTIEDFARILPEGAVFTYGNPGEGLAAENNRPSTATPPFPMPRPVRLYDAVELTISRRSGPWFGDFTYTWSRLFGNYPGLGNSDELRTPTLGFGFPTSQQQGASLERPGGNTSLAWDLDQVMFDSRGNLDVQGPLPTDRSHVLKFSGGYSQNWGRAGTTDVGTFVFAGSGTPLSTRVHTTYRLPVFVNGRGDMGRTPWLSSTDLNVAHTFPLSDNQSLKLEFTMLNVFNQKAAVHRYESLNRGAGGSRDSSAVELEPIDLFDGYDYDALILASPDGPDAYDPRYGLDDLYQPGFEGLLSLRWTF